MNILIVIPAYNEELHIIKCLESLNKQNFKATEIIIVDDASTDQTAELTTAFCEDHSGFRLIRKEKNKLEGHQPGTKIIEAFDYGMKHAQTNFDVICKFDADLIFPSNYLEKMKNKFEEDPLVGMFGGFCVIQKNGNWEVENLTGKDHLRGALKAYRKDCFNAIGGLQPYMGWDTLDELLSYFYGWKLYTDASLLVKHLKPTGANYKKELPALFGKSCYQIGYGLGLCFLASLKMALKKKKPSFLFMAIASYLQAKKSNIAIIVNQEEQKFINAYRWNKIKEKIKFF